MYPLPQRFAAEAVPPMAATLPIAIAPTANAITIFLTLAPF